MNNNGVVAAGHQETAQAASIILNEGGNAFDAVVAAHFAACVAEPALASLGGGGFLLAHSPKREDRVYDFFVHTPAKRKHADDIEFFPVSVDFGATQQEFHVGIGAVATPGVVRGLCAIQRDLGRMPLRRLIEPALQLARDGVRVNRFQAYLFDLLRAIYTFRSDTRRLFQTSTQGQGLIEEGECFVNPDFADCLECLAIEGEDLFYRGEIARAISDLCAASGGYLNRSDLENYAVIKRRPLSLSYRNARLLTNPPPSSGGLLIAFALKLLEDVELKRLGFGSAPYLQLLARVIGFTEKARLDIGLSESASTPVQRLLDEEYLHAYRREIFGRPSCSRGTTQISVADRFGNLASLTTSNGEGSGYLIPGTGIVLNNMLGEEDLNPRGFHCWEKDTRMTSMMAPSLLFLEHRRIALGSGGSNRLRSAILQFLLNLIDFRMSLEQAVNSPRIHYESGRLNVEHGFDPGEIRKLGDAFPDSKVWDSLNLFFGGLHAVAVEAGGFDGAGDPRRDGISVVV